MSGDAAAALGESRLKIFATMGRRRNNIWYASNISIFAENGGKF
jgi:hypothetical protein